MRLLPAAAALAVAAVVTMGVTAAGQSPAFRSGIDLVNLGVTVTDRKGALVTDLTADDFDIFEDGQKQTVAYFATGMPGAPGPEMHLGLMLDVSESMGEDISFTRTAAIKFLNTLTNAVDITVVDFDAQVRLARYEQADFARVIERIRQQKVSGNTALYDAIGVYLDDAAGQNGRKIMLLYTDGGDTHSALRFGELLTLLKASDVTVYAIGELEHQTSTGKIDARNVLSQVAEATGGQAFFPSDVKALSSMYDKVLAEIRAQYTIGYQSTNPRADGAWRKVEIRIARKKAGDYRVRSRKGYFGPYKK